LTSPSCGVYSTLALKELSVWVYSTWHWRYL